MVSKPIQCVRFSLAAALIVATSRAQIGTTPTTPPKLVNQNGVSDTSTDNGVSIASIANNTVMLCTFSSNDPLLSGGDTDIFVTVSRDAGATWNPPLALPTFPTSDVVLDDVEPCVANNSPSWMVVWASTNFSSNGTHGIVSVHGNNVGTSWVNPFPVGTFPNGDTVENRQPCVVATGAAFVAAWQRNDGADTDIWFSRTTGNGGPNWSAAAPLQSNAATDDGRDANVKLASDQAGRVIAVWTSNSTLGSTIGDDGDILCARSLDDGVTWSAPAALNTTAFGDTNISDFRPSIAVDRASGTWIAAWTSTNSLGGTIGNDEDILLATSIDAGATWSTPLPLNTNAATDSAFTGQDTECALEADQRGHFACVWQRTSNGTEYAIVGSRSDDLGTTWTTPDFANTNAATDSGSDTIPRITTDNSGRFVTVWNSTDSLGGTIGTDVDVLASRFLIPSPNTAVSTRYCFGFTEVGNVNVCPCGNAPTQVQEGCRNSAGRGAAVTLFDLTSVSASTVRLNGSGLTPGAAVLMFQGTAQVNAGIGISLGDGLLCVGGTISRLAVGFASASGQAIVNTTPTNVSAGAVRYYQGWYRDTSAACGGGLFNLTSAVAATWIP